MDQNLEAKLQQLRVQQLQKSTPGTPAHTHALSEIQWQQTVLQYKTSDIQARAAEAEEKAATASERAAGATVQNAKYMLWSVAAAAVSASSRFKRLISLPTNIAII